VADLLSGAGGEGGDGESGEILAERIELAIFGAELMAPFGDAVSFVNGKKRNGETF